MALIIRGFCQFNADLKILTNFRVVATILVCRPQRSFLRIEVRDLVKKTVEYMKIGRMSLTCHFLNLPGQGHPQTFFPGGQELFV